MSHFVYTINKGINKPIEFKGLQAQYIWYLAIGLLVLLIFFALLYICGVNSWLCVLIIAVLGAMLFTGMYHLSHTYGQHGLMKKYARRLIPPIVKVRTRKVYTQLSWKNS